MKPITVHALQTGLAFFTSTSRYRNNSQIYNYDAHIYDYLYRNTDNYREMSHQTVLQAAEPRNYKTLNTEICR
jgi:hypothetical protein